MSTREFPSFTPVGCYPIIYVTKECEVLCASCASEHRGKLDRDVHWEGEPLPCDGCGEDIESAYGVPRESYEDDDDGYRSDTCGRL